MISLLLSALIALLIVAPIDTVSISMLDIAVGQAFLLWLVLFCVFYSLIALIGKVFWLIFGRK